MDTGSCDSEVRAGGWRKGFRRLSALVAGRETAGVWRQPRWQDGAVCRASRRVGGYFFGSDYRHKQPAARDWQGNHLVAGWEADRVYFVHAERFGGGSFGRSDGDLAVFV